MRAVTLERATRRLVALWTLLALTLATIATGLAVAAGGNSEWTRWTLGAIAIVGFGAATRFRVGLYPGVVSGVLMLAVVPHDATLDRGVVAAIGALLVVLAAEAAQVARRLVTVAPVRSSGRDMRALARLATAGGAGLIVTAVIAQLDRWGSRAMVLGLALAAAAALASLGRAGRERAIWR